LGRYRVYKVYRGHQSPIGMEIMIIEELEMERQDRQKIDNG
jgi:hypothetical protein